MVSNHKKDPVPDTGILFSTIRRIQIMGNKAFDVTALGELLIDFTENGSSAQGNPMLEANPGGAPCNVLAMLEKLGKKTAFIGKVGNDMFGTQLKNAVEEVGIDTRNLVIDKVVHTTLAFVHTYPDGDRDFSFYRNPGADMMLTKDEIQEDLIRDSRIFHFGTLSSTHEGVREATRYAIDVAKEAGCIVSFDPNLRPPLWKSLDDAKAEIESGASFGYGMPQFFREVSWFRSSKSSVRARPIPCTRPP